jgi:hypothetical protein
MIRTMIGILALLQLAAAQNPSPVPVVYPPAGPATLPGDAVAAVKFYGAEFFNNDWIEVADDASLDPQLGDFSVSLWFKMSGTGDAVFAKYTLSDTDGWRLYQEASGYLSWQVIEPSGDAVNNQTDVITNDGNWHFLTGTVDRTGTGKCHLYIDGQEVGTAPDAPSGDVDSGSKMMIGRFDGGDERFFTGNVCLIRVGDGVVRSLAQHQADMLRADVIGWETSFYQMTWADADQVCEDTVGELDGQNGSTPGVDAGDADRTGPHKVKGGVPTP